MVGKAMDEFWLGDQKMRVPAIKKAKLPQPMDILVYVDTFRVTRHIDMSLAYPPERMAQVKKQMEIEALINTENALHSRAHYDSDFTTEDLIRGTATIKEDSHKDSYMTILIAEVAVYRKLTVHCVMVEVEDEL